MKNQNSVLVSISNSILLIPTPLKFSYFWNFGSLLGLYLFLQILSGLFLSMNYTSFIDNSFESVNLIDRDVEGGKLIHILHVFGASIFFVFLYMHVSRGIYYGSFKFFNVWMSGVTILVISMAVAFLGYVLPWGQMSYWGATVITNFLSVIPYLGFYLVMWVWGGFSVNSATLVRFFSLHFLLPFVILFLVVIHIIFLHVTGSNNPLFIESKGDKVSFNPYFVYKDILGFVLSFFVLIIFFIYYESFIESQNFIQSKSLVTPEHIQPEWYFLSAYAVLRSVPRKLGGVLLLLFFILILYFLPFFSNFYNHNFRIFFQFLWWFWVSNFFFLLWLGSKPVEDPYVFYCRLGTMIYFFFYFALYIMSFP